MNVFTQNSRLVFENGALLILRCLVRAVPDYGDVILDYIESSYYTFKAQFWSTLDLIVQENAKLANRILEIVRAYLEKHDDGGTFVLDLIKTIAKANPDLVPEIIELLITKISKKYGIFTVLIDMYLEIMESM